MRAWVVASIVLLVIASGCLGRSGPSETSPKPSDTPTPPDYDPTLIRTVVHGLDGMLLPNETYPGALPEMQQQYVATANAAEPTVAVLGGGIVFYEALSVSFKPELYRSRDLGASWQKVTPAVRGVVDFPPLTNDPFVTEDAATGRIFMVDLGVTVDCSVLQWSDDEGATWTQTFTDVCGNGSGSHDHQSLTTGMPRSATTQGYDNVVYYCVNRGTAFCYASLDGGLTLQAPVSTGLNYCGGLTGHVVTGPDGTVYLGQVSCSGASDEKHGKDVWVAISQDDGQSWEAVLVSNTTALWTEFNTAHDGHIAVDAANNVYYMFLDNESMPRLSVSRDHGRHWSPPARVAVPGLTAASFLSVTAGAEGRVAFQYIGTTAEDGRAAPNSPATTWNAYVGFSLNALDEEPVFATTTVNALEDPIRRGTCNGRCPGDGMFEGMWDFLDIDVDPETGRVFTALVDLCNDPCAPPSGSQAGVAATGRAAVGVQVGGATLHADAT